MSGSAVVTVNALPAVFNVTGGGSYCSSGAGVAVGLSGSATGVSYLLRRGATNLSTLNGTGAAISFGNQTVAGIYTVVATTTSSGCTNDMNGSATVAVIAGPAVFSVTGGGSYCSGGAGVAIGLSGSTSGVNYQLNRGAVNVATLAGTGSAISFGNQTVAGTYTVVAIAAGCSNVNMSGNAVVAVSALPTLFNVTSAGGTGGATQTLFAPSDVPLAPTNNDGRALEAGMRFRATQNGTVNGIRYYKGAGTTGTHTGHLWTNTGILLASVTFTGETASGWQEALFSTPVAITAGVTYVASYFSPSGQYPSTVNYFTTAKVNGSLRGLANNEDGLNGVYRYSNVTAFPTVGHRSSNYWVDVVFAASTGGSCNSTVGLSGSQTGVNYQLIRNGSPTVSTVAGTGSAISFGTQTITGTYTVVATNAANCTVSMNGNASITCISTRTDGVTTDIITKAEPAPLRIDIAAYPNPSETHFNVTVKSPLKETVEVRMYDISGRVIEMRRGAPDQVLRFGENVAAGMYLLEARQQGIKGNPTIKVIKQN
jgi:hypothetical protein